MNSANIKIGIISHIDQTERKFVLPENERKADMLKRLFRWSKIEHNGILWEEFKFFQHITEQEHKMFNIWEMPIYSGLHVENVVKKFSDNATTFLVNAITDDNMDFEYARLKQFDPDCIFLSTTFILNKEQLSSAVQSIRVRFYDIPIVLGGHFVFKEMAYGYDSCQLLNACGENVHIINSKFGEKEITFFLKNIKNGEGVNRIKISTQNRIVQFAPVNEKYDIDNWVIDFDRLHYDKRLSPLKASVGCPFSCSFCSYPGLGMNFIQADIQTTINQLKVLHARNVKMLIFTDDTLNVPAEKFIRLLQLMVQEGLIDFQCFSFCRCQYLTEEIVKLMKACGFEAVLLGIESGSRSVLEHMNKRAQPEDYLKGIALLKKYGITTFGAIIIGHPGETGETVKETVEFLNRSGLDYCYIQPFYYLHNSPIHQKALEYDLTGQGLHWKHKTMSSVQCMVLLDNLVFEINGPVYANEEYAMWEMIYFLFKGYTKNNYRDYRVLLNNLRRLDLKREDKDKINHNQYIHDFRQVNNIHRPKVFS